MELNNALLTDIKKSSFPQILAINSEKYDFVNNESDKKEVVAMIKEMIDKDFDRLH